MNAKESKDDVSGVEIVSEKDEYLWAYLSLKHGLDLIENLNEQFSKFVDLNNILDLVELNNSRQFEKDLKDYREQLDKIGEMSKQEGLKNVLIPLDVNKEFYRRRYEMIVRSQSTDIVRDMSLIYAVALFESFLQRILVFSFRNQPETLMTCQKKITYEELLKLNNINDAKSEIIEKEIMIVNEDIEDVRIYIKRKFSVEISDFADWEKFRERFYRRNVLIHNSGMPNKLYRTKVGYKGENKRLTVSKDYLTESIVLFNSMSSKIGLTFAEKMKKVSQ